MLQQKSILGYKNSEGVHCWLSNNTKCLGGRLERLQRFPKPLAKEKGTGWLPLHMPLSPSPNSYRRIHDPTQGVASPANLKCWRRY